MGFLRRLGQSLGSMFRPRPKPVHIETVTLPDLIGWFVENKDIKAAGVIAFSYVHTPPGRPPARLVGLPEIDKSVPGQVVVQGFYDQQTEEVLRFRTIYTQRIDDEVAESHAGKDMVVYQ